MNKRKKNILLHAGLPFAALAAVVVGIYLWFFVPKDYQDLIPGESLAVLEFDVSAAQKLLAVTGMPISDNASSLGLDTEESVFAFITPNEFFALAAAVQDSRKVSLFASRLAGHKAAGEVRREDGVSLVWLNKGWQLAWTDKALLLIGPGTAQLQDELRQTALQLFKARRAASFRHSDKASLFDDLSGDARLYCTANALPSPFSLLLRLGTPAAADPGKIQFFASLKNNGSSFRVEGNLTSTDDDVRRQLEEFEKSLPAIAAYNLPADPAEALLSLTATIKGEEAERLLLSDAMAKPLMAAIGRGIDLRTVLKNINSLALHVETLDKDFSPTFCLLATTDTTKSMPPAEAWIRSTTTTEDSANVRRANKGYVLQTEGHSLYFGKDGDSVWFASSENLIPVINTKENNPLDVPQGQYVGFRVDTERLLRQPALQGMAAQILTGLFGNTRSITANLSTGGKFKMEVE